MKKKRSNKSRSSVTPRKAQTVPELIALSRHQSIKDKEWLFPLLIEHRDGTQEEMVIVMNRDRAMESLTNHVKAMLAIKRASDEKNNATHEESKLKKIIGGSL